VREVCFVSGLVPGFRFADEHAASLPRAAAPRQWDPRNIMALQRKSGTKSVRYQLVS